MSIRIVQLGQPRHPAEGLRLGTVRRPPRGIRKSEFASRNYYDVWLPQLSPDAELLKTGQAALEDGSGKDWQEFARRFRAEMSQGDAARLLDMLAALSHQTGLSVGCYCADERRCHRSILRALLQERGADIVEADTEQ